jgi:hypothetical protein
MAKQVVLNGAREFQLNLTTLNKGVYFLTVKGGASEQTFKILVQ